ncbi:MAG: DNA gyrase inhibitor YacG [Acidobacteriota bacterium]|nr:DNA gyrase inhibitor YacG [Acidobacteriota bacterium]
MPLVICPTCGRQTEYTGNEFRPFCSERCKMIDFGAWADEEFALPAETASLTEEDLVKIEQELNKKINAENEE